MPKKKTLTSLLFRLTPIDNAIDMNMGRWKISWIFISVHCCVPSGRYNKYENTNVESEKIILVCSGNY